MWLLWLLALWGLIETFDSLAPPAFAYSLAVWLMWEHEVAWVGRRLVRKSEEPKGYWTSFTIHAVFASCIVLAFFYEVAAV